MAGALSQRVRPGRVEGWIAAGGVLVGSALLIAFLATHDRSAPSTTFPVPQAVPVTAGALQRVGGGRATGWILPDAYAGPRDVAVQPSGTVWVTEQNKGVVAVLSQGKAVSYKVDAKFPNSGTFALAAGPGGSMWFTGYPNGNIGRILPDGTVNSFASAVDASGTVAATQADDGSMWITDVNLGVVFRIDGVGHTSVFSVPAPNGTNQRVAPYDIATGTNGRLWFTDPRTRSIGRIGVGGTEPSIVEIPTQDQADPRSIAVGRDGQVWVSFSRERGIGRLDQSTGVARMMPVQGAQSPINNLAVAPDGSLWVTTAGREILHVRPNGGLIERIELPGDATGADGIAIAPDGTVWAAATDANMVVEIRPRA
ncbi:MAG TPA: hypothetical protein VK646_01395 [Actinomycetota bacterium]|nr:hypothetical protein [Actinomycetota bacterium]